jgi:hypothetical protein
MVNHRILKKENLLMNKLAKWIKMKVIISMEFSNHTMKQNLMNLIKKLRNKEKPNINENMKK